MTAKLQRVFIRQLQIRGSTMGTQDEFRALLLVAEQRQFVPVIDWVYPFEQALAALDYLDQGQQFGKLALVIC